MLEEQRVRVLARAQTIQTWQFSEEGASQFPVLIRRILHLEWFASNRVQILPSATNQNLILLVIHFRFQRVHTFETIVQRDHPQYRKEWMFCPLVGCSLFQCHPKALMIGPVSRLSKSAVSFDCA